MYRNSPSALLDAHGRLVEAELTDLLCRLRPRLCRCFPVLTDDVMVVEILEEAARRLLRHTRNRGPIARRHGLAWVTLRNVALSRVALSRTQVWLREARDPRLLHAVHAREGSPEAIERRILLQQLLRRLSTEERRICLAKRAGISSAAIARVLGRSVSAVDTIYARAKRRLRDALHERAERPSRWPAPRDDGSRKLRSAHPPAPPARRRGKGRGPRRR